MFSRVREFITRHRKKFIVTGVVIGTTFFVIKYAQRKLIEFQGRQAQEFFEQTRRVQHFESTERTCNQVIIGLNAELCQAILRECSTDELLDQLRRNPPNKVELWEEMKIVAFTRLTAFIYASSMIVVALRVQMNLLGGYLYQDVTKGQKEISDELKEQYMSLIRHFLSDGGLQELIQLIKSKVVSIIKPISLQKRLTLSDLEQIFYSLQMAINSDDNDPNTKLSRYVLPTQLPDYNMSGPLLEKMLIETQDLLETEDATNICSNNVCRGFSLATDAITEGMSDTLMLNLRSSPGSESEKYNSAVLNINSVEVALAKVIPVVSGITARGFDSSSRPQNLATALITFYVVAEKNKTLGANVYETFSSS